MSELYLNKAQFKTELEKCLQCPSKPCMKACPVLCSPCDFIASAQNNDYAKAAELIYKQNPLGEVCGLICPDKFCMKACLRAKLDYSIKIPPVQATIMKIAREKNLLTSQSLAMPVNIKVAIIGGGPAGIGAATELIKHGIAVTVYEKENHLGGALNLIPTDRLPTEIIDYEWQKLQNNPLIKVETKMNIDDYESLLAHGYDALIVATGEQKSRSLGIDGENLAIDYKDYLSFPQKHLSTGHVAIIGGGAVAVDCAITAVKQGATHVEMFVRRRIGDMRITPLERESLLQNCVDITTMTRVTKIMRENGLLTAYTIKTRFDDKGKLIDEDTMLIPRKDIDMVILALGSSRAQEPITAENIYYAGDYINGGSTAVEAVASGQKAAQQIAEKFKNIQEN